MANIVYIYIAIKMVAMGWMLMSAHKARHNVKRLKHLSFEKSAIRLESLFGEA